MQKVYAMAVDRRPEMGKLVKPVSPLRPVIAVTPEIDELVEDAALGSHGPVVSYRVGPTRPCEAATKVSGLVRIIGIWKGVIMIDSLAVVQQKTGRPV